MTGWRFQQSRKGRYLRPTSIPSTRTSETFRSTVLTPSFTDSVALLRATKVVEKARGAKLVAGARVARVTVHHVRNEDIVVVVGCFDLDEDWFV